MKERIEEELTAKLPKLELSMNHVLVTANVSHPDSGIIKSVNAAQNPSKDPALLGQQEVLAVGPYCKKENGVCYEVGDRVCIDLRKIGANNSMVVGVAYLASTGKVLFNGDDTEFEDDDVKKAIIITDREILYKFTS